VDHWALRLAERVQRMYPSFPNPARTYSHTMTMDVDNGLKYLGRPAPRQFAAAVRDMLLMRFKAAVERFGVLAGKRPDPFIQAYDRFTRASRSGHVQRAIAFILARGGGQFDHAADLSHPVMAGIIRDLARSAEIGIHPSYESSVDPDLVTSEKVALESIAPDPIRCSRQHFLRSTMPDTPTALEHAGLREDHTLGFADRPGFRAGTCTPFRWYDLQQDRVSDLVLHPFAVMDSVLHDRMRSSPEQAVAEMAAMSDAVRQVAGTFISVWHDRFLSGHGQWRAWPGVFEMAIKNAAP
jgi:hypothetical protein